MAIQTPSHLRSTRADGLRSWLAVGSLYSGVAVAGWTVYGIGVLEYSVTAAASLAAISLALLVGSVLVRARAPDEQRARMAGLLQAGGRDRPSPLPQDSASDRLGGFDALDPSDPLNRARWEDDLASLSDSPDIDIDAVGVTGSNPDRAYH